MTNNSNEVFVESFTNEAKNEAKVLLNHASSLSKAYESGSKENLLYALDSYLKLWVEIETSAKSAKNLLPETVKNNLIKLSKFVARTILSKGVNLTKEDLNCLVNLNMQISSGILEQSENHLAFEEAISLLQCAISLSNAKESNNATELVSALDSNMKVWVYLKTKAKKSTSTMSSEAKDNLVKLADYISAKTVEVGQNLNGYDSKVLDNIINTNLQVTEGLVANRIA
ncbi:MAG: flagellar biosynthesis regulator FlaF [Alphaproteobacteria bacterium]